MEILLLILVGLPLLNFLLLMISGKNHPLKGRFASLTTGISFGIAVLFFFKISKEAKILSASFTWISFQQGANNISLGGGYLADKLSALMLLLITGISTLVHVFSTEYIRNERYEYRYWGYLGLFCFSMLGIVLSNSFLFLFIFWELVGLSSYLLIGFWFGKDAAARASQKAFLLNRIGDIGFISAILLLYAHFGTTNIVEILRLIQEQPLPNGEMTLIGVLLFGGCIGKSAQFPLQVWLPDAMEGPTPVSSLIHAATMVAAGVYLLVRAFGIFTQEALLVIGVSGAITAFAAAYAALSQWDIKRVLAYSTLSQLGLMVAGIGAGAPVFSMFHLVTHAFFKCGLFLCAAILIHAVGHEIAGIKDTSGNPLNPQDMRNMGGLRKFMPYTFVAFALCIASLAGVPFFSGFLSKEAILTALITNGIYYTTPLSIFIAISAVLTTLLTAVYSTKTILWVFFGENQLQKQYPNHTFLFHDGKSIMLVPVIILGGFSIFLPFSINPFSAERSWLLQTLSNEINTAHHTEINQLIMMALSLALVVVGGFIGFRFFFAPSPQSPNTFLYRLSLNHFYQNQLFEFVGKKILHFCEWLALFDRKVIDGLVNGVANFVAGRNIRQPSASLVVRMVDQIFSDISTEKELVSLSFLFAKFDNKWIDGIVNGIASGIKNIGETVKNHKEGNIQRFVLMALWAILIFISLIGIWIYKTKNKPQPSVNTPAISIPIVSDPDIYPLLRTIGASDSVKAHAIRQIVDIMEPKEEPILNDTAAFGRLARQIYSLTQGEVELTTEDYHFFNTQNKSELRINKDSLQGFTIVSYANLFKLLTNADIPLEEKEKEWEAFKKENPEKEAFFFFFSPPIFSLNRRIAILNVSTRCGSLCGGGHKLILIKKEDRWEILTKMFLWTS